MINSPQEVYINRQVGLGDDSTRHIIFDLAMAKTYLPPSERCAMTAVISTSIIVYLR